MMDKHEGQSKTLMEILMNNRNTDYGRRYGFEEIKTVGQFRGRLPVAHYGDYAPLITLMRELGESNIFTSDDTLCYILSFGCGGEARVIPYTQRYMELFGAASAADTPYLYFSPEALIGVGVADSPEEYTLLPYAGFFEFAPIRGGVMDEAGALLPEELEAGGEYGVIVTNCLGFYRYKTDDVVRVSRIEKGVPVISVCRRGEATTDFSGIGENRRFLGTAGKDTPATTARY
ncbi:MAG: GH3 auxin-responsive promoter family protein [Clostridiales Family XIII bacterium]|nr:GH3 auxin-responsive promoter family protein [Clostridiales Family XIII bacterium]